MCLCNWTATPSRRCHHQCRERHQGANLMQLRIEIDGNAVSSILGTITITKQISGRNPTASFSLKVVESAGVPDGSIYIPQNFSEVIIYDNVTDAKVLRGFVTQIEITP